MNVTCPHCHKTITETDFKSDQLALASLTEYLAKEKRRVEEEAIQKLRSEINREFQEKLSYEKQAMTANQQRLEAEYRKQESEFNLKLEAKKNELLKMANERIEEIRKTEIQKFETKLEESTKFVAKLTAEKNSLETTLNLVKQKELSDLERRYLVELQNKDQIINSLKETAHSLELKNAENRVIQSGIMGSNFESELEEQLREVFFEDQIEKTKNIGDLLISFGNEDQPRGRVMIEVKGGEDLLKQETKIVDKALSDGIARKADFILIVGKELKTNFKRTRYENVFIIRPIIPLVTSVINILKLLLTKRLEIENLESINRNNSETINNFLQWIDKNYNDFVTDFNKSISEIQTTITQIDADSKKQIKNLEAAKTRIIKSFKTTFEKKLQEQLPGKDFLKLTLNNQD